jgi:hypothetical protein
MNKAETEIQVDCYAGYRADETPRRFLIGGRLIEIVSVIDRSLTPDYRYFKVRGNDDCVYVLRQSLDDGKWKLD